MVVWPLMAPWMVGAEMTRPSSVQATFSLTCAAVYSAHAPRPSDRKSSRTIHSPAVGAVPAEASPVWAPSMIVGPSRYFGGPSSEQAAN